MQQQQQQHQPWRLMCCMLAEAVCGYGNESVRSSQEGGSRDEVYNTFWPEQTFLSSSNVVVVATVVVAVVLVVFIEYS